MVGFAMIEKVCEGKSLILGYSNLWGSPPVQ